MIAFPELIKWGRLGNHLFEMATTIALAKDHDDEFGFNRSWNGSPWSYFDRFPIGKLPCFHDQVPPGPEYREPVFHYTPIPYQKDLRLYGYFFSPKYFQHRADLIRSLLTPYGVPDRSAYKNVCSVHVRRGDYVHLQDQHPVLPIRYYETATNMMAQKYGVGHFIVFSDDSAWCRGVFGKNFEIAHDAQDTRHLATMIACEHHIVANSTFSWWGAWLNPAPGAIVRPSKWFGPAYSHDEKDLWPESWIPVDCKP